MKYKANRPQDHIDISNIITHLYNGNFEVFKKEAEPIIKSYFEEESYNVIIGNLKNIYDKHQKDDDSIYHLKSAARI